MERIVTRRQRIAGGCGQSLAARLLLCLALVCQFVAVPACRATRADEASPTLAALAKVLGHHVILCHAGEARARDQHGPGGDDRADHPCCDCDRCGATTLLPPRADGLGLVVPVEADPVRRAPRPVPFGAPAPSVVATGPRGPPVLV